MMDLGLPVPTGGEEDGRDGGGDTITLLNGRKLLCRSSFDECSLLLGSPLFDTSQSVKEGPKSKSKTFNGRNWRKRCRSDTSDTEVAPPLLSPRSFYMVKSWICISLLKLDYLTEGSCTRQFHRIML
ncbi:unnamed protein product [Thelazia callipaeda]|uniref:Uncharacterized protein n=1 Tax=Thelazia callipaeda TaxID=103827 RepID=A0A0N5D3V1_THECL|nr:unnamed protein product [Thelazia callipaeda]